MYARAPLDRGNLNQFHRHLLVQNLTDGQGDDHLGGLLEKSADLREGVGREIERDEKALGAVLAHHHGLEGVDFGVVDIVPLLHMPRVPTLRQGLIAPPVTYAMKSISCISFSF